MPKLLAAFDFLVTLKNKTLAYCEKISVTCINIANTRAYLIIFMNQKFARPSSCVLYVMRANQLGTEMWIRLILVASSRGEREQTDGMIRIASNFFYWMSPRVHLQYNTHSFVLRITLFETAFISSHRRFSVEKLCKIICKKHNFPSSSLIS